MTQSIWFKKLDQFFFKPEPVTRIAVLRIWIGLMILLTGALLLPDWETWFGEKGPVSFEASLLYYPLPRLDLFSISPNWNAMPLFVLGLLFISGTLVTLGLLTRPACFVAFFSLCSLQYRNPAIIHSGDSLLKILVFLLGFSAAGQALSLDSWLSRRLGQTRRKKKSQPRPRLLHSPWALRLIQIQICTLYLTTGVSKLFNTAWRDGSAVYYVLRLEEFSRFPVPAFVYTLGVSRFLSWSTLAIELSLATLIWIPGFRYPVLALGVLLHLGIEYSMNIPVFELLMIGALVSFVPSDDLNAILLRGKRALGRSARVRRHG